MRILEVCAHPDTPMVVAYLTGGLAEKGHHVDLVVPGPGMLSEYVADYGVKVHYLPIRSSIQSSNPVVKRWIDLRVIYQLRRLVQKERYDLVHLHLLRSEVFGRIASVGLPVTVVTTLHGIYSERSYRWLQHVTRRRDDAVVAVSQAIQRFAVADGWSPGMVKVIYNHLPIAAWDQIPTSGGELRDSLGISRSAVVVGLVGRILPDVKGHEVLLKALPMVLRKFPDTVVLIVGSEPDGGRARTAKLMELASSLGVEDRCRFTGNRNDIPAVMDALDVLVLPSLVPEAFGMVLLEAMVRHVPVVASDIGGIPEVISDGKTGILVPPGNDSALAEALCNILSNPATRAVMTEAARTYVEQHFDSQKVTDEYDGLFSQIIAT